MYFMLLVQCNAIITFLQFITVGSSDIKKVGISKCNYNQFFFIKNNLLICHFIDSIIMIYRHLG